MKQSILLLSLALALPGFAGTSAKQEIAPAPAADCNSERWFLGTSAGYLFDYDEPFYAIHAGVDTPWKLATADIAFFVELGYTNPDETYSFGQIQERGIDIDVEREIVPLTFNVKFEKAIVGNLSAYIGAGIGAAWVNTELSAEGESFSDSEVVLTGQAFTGLIYNVNSNFEVYGGARWIYLEDTSAFGIFDEFTSSDNPFSDAQNLHNDWVAEVGVRYTF